MSANSERQAEIQDALINNACPRCQNVLSGGAKDDDGLESRHCFNCGTTVYIDTDGTLDME